MSDFYVILTDAGQALMAAATAGGDPVVLSKFGVDDGNGAAFTPDPAQTALINEVYQGDISSLQSTGNTIKAQLVIPKDSGGYTVRGFGLYTEDGALFSVCNFPPQEKPLPSSGYAVKMDTDYYLQVTDTSLVELQFNGDDYLTREEADTIYLQIANNLSEIQAGGAAAQQAARDNLGLKSAAIHDVTTSQTDTTAGSVLNVGYGGLGGNAPRTAVVASDSYDYIPTGLPSGFYTHCVDGGPYAVTFTLRQDGGGTLNNRHLIIPMGPNNKIAVRFDGASGVGTKEYQYFYTDKNKPTAVDVGALPLTGGALTNDSAVLTLKNKTLDKSLYILARNQDGANRWYVGNGSDSNDDVLLSNYIGGNRLQLTADGSIALTVSGGKSCTVNGEFVPSNYGNFDARYYTQSAANTKFVTATQLGAQGTLNASSGTTSAPTGCVLTGGGDFGADNGSYYYRPLQYVINGTPHTAAFTTTAQAMLMNTGAADTVDPEPLPISSVGVMLNCQPYNNLLAPTVDGQQLQCLRDEQGLDWYVGAKLMTGAIFIAYEPDTGLIKNIDENVLNIWPWGLSVRGVESVPDSCSIDGTWFYDAGTGVISQHIDAVKAKNKKALARQMVVSSSYFFMLQSCQTVGTAQDGDTDRLLQLQQYASDLRAVDLTQPEPAWPPAPEFMN